MFFKGSRYEVVGETQLTDKQGRVIRYKKIRIIPATTAQAGHRVDQGERLDHIAHLHFRDPERFWRICDLNQSLWPDDLVSEPGRIILIPAAEG